MQAGGTSLQTGAVCSCVRKALGLTANIPAAWLFTGQTVRALASRISREVLAPNASCNLALLPTASKAQAVAADAIDAPMVLSFQQVSYLCMAVAAQVRDSLHTTLSSRAAFQVARIFLCRSNSCSCGSRTQPAVLTIPPGASACKAG